MYFFIYCIFESLTSTLDFWCLLFSICYQFCTKNLVFSTHFYLGVWLLAWLFSPLLDSPFSPPGHLYLLPPPSLLYPTLWISWCVPGCGEHLGNWLLAGSVSLLLTPSFLLLATSVSFLPLLFITLWTSLRNPDCAEHIGKWLLASLLSPLLIPPHLIWVTSNSLLSILFSM